jgi:hypothetical protein
MLQDIAFITLTNDGYIEYTENCLKSLEKINSKINLKCYCIGKKGYEYLNNKKYNCVLIDEEENSNFQNFREGNWSNITFNKFVIIYENLLKYKYVCITDGDIVFENNNFLQYLLENIELNDFLIQTEYIDDKNFDLCSGFMFIKSNSNTLNFFNPKYIEHKKNTSGWDDQIYINTNKHKLKYKMLPIELFLNGNYYYNNNNNNNNNPYLIHFNWIIGDKKKEKMRDYAKWYLEQF